MVAVLLVLLLLVLLFGSLGIFVAKIFFGALLIVALLSFLTGGYMFRRRGH